jgi:hypothetical protein
MTTQYRMVARGEARLLEITRDSEHFAAQLTSRVAAERCQYNVVRA